MRSVLHEPLVRQDLVRALAPLLDDVVAARHLEREHQARRGITAMEVARLRRQTLDALEDYAAALDTLAWPVPRAVLQEMRLYRALLGAPASNRTPHSSH